MTDQLSTRAAFTGAGISTAAPASLPAGNELRDRLLALMHEQAQRLAPDLTDAAQLAAFTASSRKLEVALGRLWGILGDDALDCLLCLHVAVPNEAHLLAALHLARGGLHVTVNFDRGIELAGDLLAGRAELPPDAPRELH